MSDQKIVELRGGKLKKPTSQLPKFKCVKCGAENTLPEALTAGLMDEMSSVAQDKAAKQYEEKLIIEREKWEREKQESSSKQMLEQLAPMRRELEKLTTRNMELEIAKAKTDADKEALVQTRKAEIEVAAKKAVDQVKADYELKLVLKTEENDRLTKSIDALKSNSNPGSSELSGESGELVIGGGLKRTFPRDLVQEIKKGHNGADFLWSIKSNGGSIVGKILFESKVTQKFQSNWISKLKNDMVEKGANIGVIVTKTMPNENELCHVRDGIWICGFHEFETLAKALRQGQVELSRARNQDAAKESSASELFDFVVGHEFSSIMEKILRPIFEQQQLLDKEKRSITRIWKARETHIQNSVEGASLLAGQLETILGASVVNQLGFENFDILEVIEEDDKDA